MATLIGAKTTKAGNRIEVYHDGDDFYATLDGVNVASGDLRKMPANLIRKAGLPDGSYCMMGQQTLVFLLHEAAPILKEMDRINHANDIKIDGLDELRAAYHTMADYHDRAERMMETGKIATRPSIHIEALKAQYPRAAAYLKAESYSNASNDRKSDAGLKAMRLIADGGEVSEALAILANWLPESAFAN